MKHVRRILVLVPAQAQNKPSEHMWNSNESDPSVSDSPIFSRYFNLLRSKLFEKKIKRALSVPSSIDYRFNGSRF